MNQQLAEKQPVINQIIKNAFLGDLLSHAYLFEGQRGTGKREAAMLLTKLYLCENPTAFLDPCNECTNCKRVDSRNHPDVHYVIPEGQTIKKEQIQMLQKEFSMSGVESSRKIYVIEHVDRMTASAANSLLKFLEEPSQGTIAILLTEQPHGLLSTIISRCQVLKFLPLSNEKTVEQLRAEGIDNVKVQLLASLTSNVEEAKEWSKDEWFDESLLLIKNFTNQWFQSPMKTFIVVQEGWMSHFSEKEKQLIGIELLTLWLKDLLYISVGKDEKVHFKEFKQDLYQQMRRMNLESISFCLAALSDVKKKISNNVNYQLVLESYIIQVLKVIYNDK